MCGRGLGGAGWFCRYVSSLTHLGCDFRPLRIKFVVVVWGSSACLTDFPDWQLDSGGLHEAPRGADFSTVLRFYSRCAPIDLNVGAWVRWMRRADYAGEKFCLIWRLLLTFLSRVCTHGTSQNPVVASLPTSIGWQWLSKFGFLKNF